MYKKLALVCAKESTVSVQLDERNGFFAYVYTGSFPVYVCDTRTQAQAKAQEYKNCFITPCEYLLLRRVVACPNRDDATKHTSWVNVACVVCVKGEYTQRFNCSHTRVRYSIVTEFASVLVCYCKMKSASIVGDNKIKLPLPLVSVFWSLYVSQLTNWGCFRYRETIQYWPDCGLTGYVTRTSFIASVNPFCKWE